MQARYVKKKKIGNLDLCNKQANVPVLRPGDGCLPCLCPEIPQTGYYSCAPKYHRQTTAAPLRKKTDDYSSAPKEDRNCNRSAPKDDRRMIAALFRKKTDYHSYAPKDDRRITTAAFRNNTEELLQLHSEIRQTNYYS